MCQMWGNHRIIMHISFCGGAQDLEQETEKYFHKSNPVCWALHVYLHVYWSLGNNLFWQPGVPLPAWNSQGHCSFLQCHEFLRCFTCSDLMLSSLTFCEIAIFTWMVWLMRKGHEAFVWVAEETWSDLGRCTAVPYDELRGQSSIALFWNIQKLLFDKD